MKRIFSDFTLQKQTFSITFGDVAENHKGMQKIGNLSSTGFSLEDLQKISFYFEQRGCPCKIIPLHNLLTNEDEKQSNQAYILVVRNAVNHLLDMEDGHDLLFSEQQNLKKDTKALMYGRVVNKHARHNLCFGETHQSPCYEEGKGTVYAFEEVPLLNRIRIRLGELFGEKTQSLQAEGNYYYDSTKCGIGYHGDSERKKVIAIRLGETIPLCYVWYKNNKQISEVFTISDLHHGDMYIMSEKATGFDWKCNSKCTLRHAAGSDKYIKINEK